MNTISILFCIFRAQKECPEGLEKDTTAFDNWNNYIM